MIGFMGMPEDQHVGLRQIQQAFHRCIRSIFKQIFVDLPRTAMHQQDMQPTELQRNLARQLAQVLPVLIRCVFVQAIERFPNASASLLV